MARPVVKRLGDEGFRHHRDECPGSECFENCSRVRVKIIQEVEGKCGLTGQSLGLSTMSGYGIVPIGRFRLILGTAQRSFEITTSGFPFSTMYVASSAPLTVPAFFAAWIVPAGMNKTSPGPSVIGGLPSISYSSTPSMT